MKTSVKQALFSAILTASTFISTSALADTISFRSDYWCPYICQPDSDKPGYMVEIAKTVFEKHGHRVQVLLSSWVSAIKDTRSSKVQGLMGCSIVDAPDFIFPKKSLGVMRNAYFVHHESTWLYKGRPSLQAVKIGVINGYTYGDSVDSLIRARNRSFVPFSGDRSLEQLIHATHLKQLDGFIENPVVLQYTSAAAKLTLNKLKIVGWVENQDPALYISFSPNNPKSMEYAQILSEGVEELRRSGDLQRILARYNLQDWESSGPENFWLGTLNDLGTGLFESSFDSFDVINARSL